MDKITFFKDGLPFLCIVILLFFLVMVILSTPSSLEAKSNQRLECEPCVLGIDPDSEFMKGCLLGLDKHYINSQETLDTALATCYKLVPKTCVNCLEGTK